MFLERLMKTLTLAFVIFGFTLSHAGRVDGQHRNLASHERSLKTKGEIIDYLNSLAPEELKELYDLKEGIHKELLTIKTFIAMGVTLAGMVGTIQFSKKADLGRKRFFRRAAGASLGVSVLGLLFLMTQPLFSEKNDPSTHESELAKEDLEDYINSLTLEEAREVLMSVKKINEDIKRKLEIKKDPQWG